MQPSLSSLNNANTVVYLIPLIAPSSTVFAIKSAESFINRSLLHHKVRRECCETCRVCSLLDEIELFFNYFLIKTCWKKWFCIVISTASKYCLYSISLSSLTISIDVPLLHGWHQEGLRLVDVPLIINETGELPCKFLATCLCFSHRCARLTIWQFRCYFVLTHQVILFPLLQLLQVSRKSDEGKFSTIATLAAL